MKSVLDTLIQDLRTDTKDALVSALLYGSAARGEHQRGRSDINVLLAFSACSPAVLKAAGPSLQRVWRSDRVRPYLVDASELSRVADVFPLKLWDIKSAHKVLYGEDLVSGISVDAEHLRIRVEQELRNELIRLRWQLAHNHSAQAETRLYIVRLAHRLRTVFAGVLHLQGAGLEAATFAAVREALPTLGLSDKLFDGREGPLGPLVDAAVETLEATIRIVDEMNHV